MINRAKAYEADRARRAEAMSPADLLRSARQAEWEVSMGPVPTAPDLSLRIALLERVVARLMIELALQPRHYPVADEGDGE